MKHAIYISFMLAIFVTLSAFVRQADAVNPTPTVKTLNTDQIDSLKERLATKVAQMSQTVPKAIFGKVKTLTTASMTVETTTKDMKIELTDDIRVFQTLKGKRTKLSTDDIDTGDTVAIIGDFDTSLDVLKAKTIYIQNQVPVRIAGIITQSDAKQFTIGLTGSDTQTYIVDFETTSKAFELENPDTVNKIGFSKLQPGDGISVLGYPVPKKENRISAARVFVIHIAAPNQPSASPETTGQPKTTIGVKMSPTVSPKSTPTVKIIPTARPTLKATPKPTPTTEP